MKNIFFKSAFAVTLGALIFTTSCKNDDDAPNDTIQIQLTEVGTANSGEAVAGSDVHLDAEIIASARIANVIVEIHNETDASIPEITQEFSDYNGQINANFHQHIDIPADYPAGEYHLHLTVIDANGNSETAEAELVILAATNNIQVVFHEVGEGNSGQVATGSDLHLDAGITSVHAIAGIELEIHNEADPNVAEIVHSFSNYNGQTNADFHEHVDIPADQPAGEYHLHLTITDDEGNSFTAESELIITN